MTKAIAPISQTSLARFGFDRLPRVISNAGDRACRRFVEFFTANIRNKNTRLAYAQAVGRFLSWCERRKFELELIEPVVVAAYIEELTLAYEPPTVKQHLAAIRMLFDRLVVGQVIPMNPASSVRGPKHVVKKGKTPVLDAKEARALLDSIDTTDIAGLRDRALIGLMVYSFARVSAAVGMDGDDYLQRGKRTWFRLREKGGKHHEVPAHHNAVEYVDAYLAAAPAGKKAPLFRTIDRSGELTERRLTRNDVLRMIKRRSRKAGLSADTCCHTFRATGITAYLKNGGTIDVDQSYCLHYQDYPALLTQSCSLAAPGGCPVILDQMVDSATDWRPNDPERSGQFRIAAVAWFL